MGSGFCANPNESTSKCATMYNFGELAIDAKQALAITCGFEWACAVI
jgi:hypothetical protein